MNIRQVHAKAEKRQEIERSLRMSPFIRRHDSFKCTDIEILPHRQRPMQAVDPNSPATNHRTLNDVLQRECLSLLRFVRKLLCAYSRVSFVVLVSLGISYGGKLSARLQGLNDLKHFLSSDEWNEGIHLDALDRGADRMLAWQLTQNLNTEPKDTETIWLILKCLELLWTRCPGDRLVKSANDLIDVLPWLVHSWQCFQDDARLVELVLSLFRVWSKIKDSQIKAKLIRSGVVKCIEKEASRFRHNDKRGILTLGLVKDFAFRASGAEKAYLYVALKNVILHNCKSDQPGIVEAMTATIWNLAAENAIGESMAEDQEIWNTLFLLRKKWQAKEGLVIFRNVSSIIGTIVAIVISDAKQSSSVALLQRQTWIVHSLLDTLKKESDNDLRRRCTRTIRCLVSCSWGRLFMVNNSNSINVTGMLVSLVTNNCNDSDTRVQACQAVRSMLTANKDISLCDQKIGESLVLVLEERNVDSKLAISVFQALSAIISDRRWRPDLQSFSDLFLPKISSILRQHIDETTSHLVFSQFLLEFIRVEDYRNSFQHHPDSSKKLLLDCITSLLEPLGPDFEDSRKCAVEIVTTLASNQETKKILAGHDRLLTALVNFCLIANGPMKINVKAIILTLVPEL